MNPIIEKLIELYNNKKLNDRILIKFAEEYKRKGFLTASQQDIVKTKLQVQPQTPKQKRIARLKHDKLAVYFDPLDPDFELITEKIKKEFNGQRFVNKNPNNKYREIPLVIDNVRRLMSMGFQIDPEVQQWYEDQSRNLVGINVPNLKGTMYDFQKKCVEFLYRLDGNGIIALPMGVGKSLISLAFTQLQQRHPVLIVCNNTAKINWDREIHKWIPDPTSEILHGTEPYDVEAKYIIMNYELLSHSCQMKKKTVEGGWVDKLIEELKPKTIIIDEAHRCKNFKTKTSKAVHKISKITNTCIPLTGTLLINSHIDIYNIIKFVQPQLFPKFWDFAQRYCDAHLDRYGRWDLSGNSKSSELREKIKDYMIRYRKEDILPELPKKQHIVVPLESNTYTSILNFKNHTEELDDSEGNNTNQMEKQKQNAVNQKYKQMVRWIKEFTDSGEKLVIFGHHIDLLKNIKNEFDKESVLIYGATNNRQRQELIDQFQNTDEKQIFIGQIKATGESINLTSSSNVAFVELGWTPSEHDQASDRCHRIGSIKSVNVYYLVAKETVEQQIAEFIDEKRKIIYKIQDGIEPDKQELISEFINRKE